jgi:osmoprotectant transport system substrate-binding protein
VGSKNFVEQFIVAELYAGALEAAGLPVERKINLGSTFTVHEALKAGVIDVYPEYTGTGLAVGLDLTAGAETDPAKVFEAVKAGYRSRHNLVWLNPSRVDNGYVLVTSPELASRHGLKTLSDLARVADKLGIAMATEFADRRDGLPGLKARYGITFGKVRQFSTMRLRYEALLQGEADVVNGFATDWQIADRKLVALEDDKKLFAPYELAPVVRPEVAENPAAVAALNRVSEALDTQVMRELNRKVELEGRSARTVAAEFLCQKKLAPCRQ